MSEEPSFESDGIEQLRQAAQQAERLLTICLTLNSKLEHEKLLQFIIETAADVLDCEAASILLYDQKARVLRFEATTGPESERLIGVPVPLEDSLAGTVFVEKKDLVINEVASDSRHFDSVEKEVSLRTKSLLGVPMSIEGRPTGVLEAINKREGRFTHADTEVLSVIASQAAIAIRNARRVEELREAYDKMKQLDQLKSDFMALASHELRTPLSVILGYGDIIKGQVEPEVEEHVDTMLEAGTQMREVVNVMTQMEVLRGGREMLDIQRVDLRELLQAALSAVESKADEHRHTIHLDLPDDPLELAADAHQLKLVFINVLKNAIRFTQEGGSISLCTARRASDAGTASEKVYVSVRDDGIGLADDEREAVFQEFYQVEDHLTRSHEGLGLGLTIARQIVRLHDGEIWLESDGPDQGVEACVQLPLR